MKRINNYIKAIIFSLTFLCHGFCFAQIKRDLTEKEYDRWHTLASGPVSPDGRWVSYSKLYRDGNDTLFLKNTQTGRLLHFCKGNSGGITADGNYFICMTNDTLRATGLKKHKDFAISGVAGYKSKGNTLLCQMKTVKNLLIGKTDSQPAYFLKDINEFAISDNGCMVFVRESGQGYSLEIMESADCRPRILKSNVTGFSGLTWNNSGTAFSCYANTGIVNDNKNGESILYRYQRQGNDYHVSNISLLKSFPGFTLSPPSISVSDDGDKVFFDLFLPSDPHRSRDQVTIYRYSDKTLPPKEIKIKFWHVWLVDKQCIVAVEDQDHPMALTIGEGRYALVYSHDKYLPLHEYAGYYIDVYIKDMETGCKELIVEKQLYDYQHMLVSPEGKYIAYFKDREWWLYDIKRKKHNKLTNGASNSFYNAENDYPNEESYGVAGWSKNDQELILYDKYDVWQITCATSFGKRITKGRENNITYRVYSDGLYKSVHGGFGFITESHDVANGIIIIGLDGNNYDYSLLWYRTGKGVRFVTKGNGAITAIHKAEASDDFYFLESSFSTPPQLLYSNASGKRFVVTSSNLHQNLFKWGTSKLITFDASGKRGLKAALFFPASYDPDKSYPMVVNIYQDKSKELHNYIPPSIELYDGFNITNLTSQGYFVLLPDIHFTMDKPGESALECTLAASEAAMKIANVDRNKIALIGHSFGGFETTYIISRTSFFKTAIAGAAVTDLLSFYLNIDPFKKSYMERFDNGQFRNRHLFTSPEFIEESPIHNVCTIDTPLLLWAGKDDRIVPSEDSVKLHSALWRLGKRCNLLLYPGEQHYIENPVNQADLYHKIMDWLDYYLKDGKKPYWLFY